MSTDLTPSPSDAKRDELRQKIEASERRIAERTLGDQAREAAEAALLDKAEDQLHQADLLLLQGAMEQLHQFQDHQQLMLEVAQAQADQEVLLEAVDQVAVETLVNQELMV